MDSKNNNKDSKNMEGIVRIAVMLQMVTCTAAHGPFHPGNICDLGTLDGIFSESLCQIMKRFEW